MTITELAIKRPTLVVVLFSFFGVLGIYGYTQLKYDLMPKMSAPVITISTIYPGASPNEVETSVTKVIEDATSGLDKVSSIKGNSSEGISFVTIEFDQNADIDVAVQDAARKVDAVVSQLPDEVKKPVISKLALDEIPVLRLAAQSNMPTKQFYQFIKDIIQPKIASSGGVGAVNLSGGEEREIRINVDFEKLKGFGLSLSQVVGAVKAANIDLPTGNIKQGINQYVIRVAGKFTSMDEIRDLIVARSKDGGDIQLKDIAEVNDGIKEITTISRLNGVPIIGITVQKQNDANTVEVTKNVRKVLKQMEEEYKSIGLKFDVAQDGSIFILDSAKGVGEDLLLAILLVAIVMLIFLHSMRNSLIVMVAIPASLVSTLFAMYIFDFTLNMMTLLAMSLVIGILVDDSIVVLENIYSHLEKGEDKVNASIRGRNEIGFAALSITFVDVVVFVPLALIVGVIGNVLREYALVIVFSTLMSLLVSFTVTPTLASRFSKLQKLAKNTLMGRFGLFFEKLYSKFSKLYTDTLKWSLHNGGKIAILAVLLFFISIFLFPAGFIGLEFVPNVDRGELIVTVELDPGAKLETTNQKVMEVENILRQMPEVDKIMTTVGASSEGMLSQTSNNAAELYVTLVDKKYRSQSTDDFGQIIKAKVEHIPDVRVRISAVGMLGTSSLSPIQLLVHGADYQNVQKAAKMIRDATKTIQGTTDVRLSTEDGKPEVRVDIDRKKMAQFGLTIADVGQTLNVALTGNDDSKYREGVTEYDIRVMLDQLDRSNLESVGNISFTNSKGELIQLKQFANIYQTTGMTKLQREGRLPAIYVYANTFGKTSGIIANEMMKKVKTLKLPSGVTYEFTGQQKSMNDSFGSMLWALMAGILFVYMIMVALYNSYAYPFVVLFSIPLAMIGAFFGLALMMKSISIYSMLGIIMLIGLVAKNAILLVDRANQMKAEQGISTYDALIEAGQSRLRPILMTTFAMIFGMMPIALSTAAGGEAKSGLGVVLIGGLTSSMFLTLLVVPVVYQKFDKWKLKFSQKFGKKSKKGEIAEAEN